MSKIQVQDICQSFQEIQGWPYVSPGTNNEKGIDCSGAFCRAYSKAGKTIYHGSNRIIRKHCHDVKQITSIADLQPGMAVFKARTDISKLSAQYKEGGTYYDADLPYDFYHIGQVVSVNPLRINHATTPKAKQDSIIGTWKWCGYLDEVKYTEAIETQPETPQEGTTAFVYAANGFPVKLRTRPDKASIWRYKLDVGTALEVLEKGTEWCKVKVVNKEGYMMTEFIKWGA